MCYCIVVSVLVWGCCHRVKTQLQYVITTTIIIIIIIIVIKCKHLYTQRLDNKIVAIQVKFVPAGRNICNVTSGAGPRQASQGNTYISNELCFTRPLVKRDASHCSDSDRCSKFIKVFMCLLFGFLFWLWISENLKKTKQTVGGINTQSKKLNVLVKRYLCHMQKQYVVTGLDIAIWRLSISCVYAV
jgi:hypothetical protein